MKTLYLIFFIISFFASQKIHAASFEDIELKAKSGDSYSLFKIGLVYEYGLGFDKDYNKAMDYYVKAHNAGEIKATTKLGIHFYERGNEANAVKFLQEAAKKEEGLSLAYIGKIFEDKKDYRRAFFYYEIASKKGVSMAKMNIANLYAQGLGTKKNINEAKKIYRDIIKQQNNPYYNEAVKKLREL